MKTLKIIFYSLLIVTVTMFLMFIVFIKTINPNAYLPMIAKAASDALGREVTLTKANYILSWEGLALDVFDVGVKEDPRVGTTPMVTIEKVHLRINIKPLLFKRHIDISEMLLSKPRINVVLLEDGSLNVQKIGPTKKTSPALASAPAAPPTPDAVPVLAPVSTLPILLVKKIEVEDGAVVFIDTHAGIPLKIQINHINIHSKDFSLTDPFSMAANFAFASKGENNVTANVTVRLKPTENKVDLSNLMATTDLSLMDLNAFKAMLPNLAQVPLPESVSGTATFKMPSLSAGARAPADITGQGDFNIANARLEGFNLLDSVLSRINIIPGLGEGISAMISYKFKTKMGGDDTVLDKVQVNFTVKDAQVIIDDALLQSKIFEVKAKGKAAFDGTVEISTSVYIAPDLSVDLIKHIGPLEGLLDEDKRIYVPGGVSGKAPNVHYSPDMEYVGKKLFTGEGSKQIVDQLDKVLEKNPEVKNILNSVLGSGIFK